MPTVKMSISSTVRQTKETLLSPGVNNCWAAWGNSYLVEWCFDNYGVAAVTGSKGKYVEAQSADKSFTSGHETGDKDNSGRLAMAGKPGHNDTGKYLAQL